jgi:thiol-disulfide isomerase/thioredoxin
MTGSRSIALIVTAASMVVIAASATPTSAQPEANRAAPGNSSPTSAASRPLGVGDAAPMLYISDWVKGEKVERFKQGKVYVVEFWATWCPPCKESIPHLTELQKKHKDKLTIIGISGQDSNGESLAEVRQFVKNMGEKMDYTIAFDEGRQTRRAWSEAARQRGIPHAFIVDQSGKIAWVGNPLSPDFETSLTEVVAGTFDMAKVLKARDIQEQLQLAMQAQDNPKSLRLMDELYALDKKRFAAVPPAKFRFMLMQLKDEAGAYAYVSPLIGTDLKDNTRVLADIAWLIATTPDLKARDLDLALRAATRAAELSKQQDADVLDTLARVHYERGDFAKAVEIQTKTVAVETEDVAARDEYAKSLDRYTRAKTTGKKVDAERPDVPGNR